MRFHRRPRTLNRKTKGHSYDVLANNLAEFFPCPENLSEAELKGDRQICLVEDI